MTATEAVQPRLMSLPGPVERTSDDYYTPQHVFDRIGLTFDLDVCAPPGGGPHVPAARYYTMEDDGLSAPWEGRVWMNPPFSNSTPWIRRFIHHGNGICLVQQAKSRWFISLWEAADGLAVPSEGFFPFVGGPIFMPTIFAAFGSDCCEALRGIGRLR